MPTHWTYDALEGADADLYQGDILFRTPELEAILREYHAYFLDQKFIAFLVTTQTCDLVRRKQRGCKAEHITLAVIRELEPMLPELVGKVAGLGVSGLYRKSARHIAIDLITKIINQNEQSRGIFYLHKDGDVGIATPSVCLLRISIAVRQQHYETLVKSRKGRLGSDFRNKLGWLCGNLFSRIATQDWNEHKPDGARIQAEELLQTISGTNDESWIADSWFDAVKQAGQSLEAKPKNEAIQLLKQHAPKDPLETALDRVRHVASAVIAAEQAAKIKESLKSDSTFLHDTIEHLVATIPPLFSIDDSAFREAIARLSLDALLSQSVFIKVRSYLEARRNEPISVLESEIGALSVLEFERQWRSVIRPLSGERWATIANEFGRAASVRLFPASAVERIASIVEPHTRDASTETIAKLVSRLRNDREFGQSIRNDAVQVALSDD